MYEVYSDDCFNLMIEEEQGQLFVHCEVFKHSKSTIRRIQKCFKYMKEEVFSNGFTQLFCYIQDLKFVRIIDDTFSELPSVTHEGKTYEVVRWDSLL